MVVGVSQPIASVKGEARESVGCEGKGSKPNCVNAYVMVLLKNSLQERNFCSSG